ncbi:MFS transporter [Sporichthya sp.]|uniref:MFS transporter n=1 Tax=Sporichthya sp. TaxID=65475 RepID=UPI00181EBF3F|nr:MFS transporter [Sporichthya sp.]MBA3745188.1 MFS transporter [Sporichthya sp.]
MVGPDEGTADGSVRRGLAEEGVAAAALAIWAVFFGLYALAFLCFQYQAFAPNFSPLKSALGMIPLAVLMIPLAVAGPGLARRYGVRPVVACSLLMGGLGAAIAGVLGPSQGYWGLAVGFFIFGGIGLGGAPVTEAITQRLPAAKQGVASAVNNLTRELGAVFGVAVTGTAFNMGYRHEISAALDPATDPLSELARESPAAGLAVVPQAGPEAPRYLQAVLDGVDTAWLAAMGTVAAFFALAGIVFVRAFGAGPGASQDSEPSSTASMTQAT